jgi:hypothetical protein
VGALAQIQALLSEVEARDTAALLRERPDPGSQYRQGYMTALREAVEIIEEEEDA